MCTGGGMVHAVAEAVGVDGDSSYNDKASASISMWDPIQYHSGTTVTNSDSAGYTGADMEFMGLYTNVFASRFNGYYATASWSATATVDVY